MSETKGFFVRYVEPSGLPKDECFSTDDRRQHIARLVASGNRIFHIAIGDMRQVREVYRAASDAPVPTSLSLRSHGDRPLEAVETPVEPSDKILSLTYLDDDGDTVRRYGITSDWREIVMPIYETGAQIVRIALDDPGRTEPLATGNRPDSAVTQAVAHQMVAEGSYRDNIQP
jgi:hypothetical protein